MAVHGRYAVMPELALGGMITQKNWNAINDNMKNQTLVNANAEWTMNQLKVEGTLGWAGESFDKTAARAPDTIATTNFGAAADYMLTGAASVGGGFGYAMGDNKDSANGDITVSDLTVTVRGNMKF